METPLTFHLNGVIIVESSFVSPCDWRLIFEGKYSQFV